MVKLIFGFFRWKMPLSFCEPQALTALNFDTWAGNRAQNPFWAVREILTGNFSVGTLICHGNCGLGFIEPYRVWSLQELTARLMDSRPVTEDFLKEGRLRVQSTDSSLKIDGIELVFIGECPWYKK